jgi:hypothetical protein
MPQSHPENLARANYQSIFNSALQLYQKKTRKDLPSNPLFDQLQSCGSPDEVIAILRRQVPVFDLSAGGSSDDRLTRWLDPTVRVISAFSSTIGAAVALVSHSIYQVDLYDDIFSTDIPTWRSDLHRNRHPPLGTDIHRFLSQDIIVTS